MTLILFYQNQFRFMQSAALVILIEVSLLKAAGKTSVGSRNFESDENTRLQSVWTESYPRLSIIWRP